MESLVKFIGTTIIISDIPLDVVTTNLLDPATKTPLNYVCCKSLAARFGLEKEALEHQNLPPEFKEFVFFKPHPYGEENSLLVWDTLAAAFFMTMKRYPDKPILSLPESEVLVLSAWLDQCIDIAFFRPFDPLLFMIRVSLRRMS
jgi:hypothetical protein